MASSNCIEQEGYVESTGKGVVNVRILQLSACSSCQSKESCTFFGTEKKIITVNDNSGQYAAGERVCVSVSKSAGIRAVILGYLLPFLLLVSGLIIFTSVGLNELYTGLLAICILIPYYALLYMLRNKLSNQFSFSLHKF